MRLPSSTTAIKKKALLVGAAAFILIAAYLFAFSMISTSHPISREAIAKSPEVAKSIGSLTGMILVGNRQKFVPGGNSCSKNTYLVIGDAGWVVVVSELSMRGRQSDWSVERLTLGWFTGESGNC